MNSPCKSWNLGSKLVSRREFSFFIRSNCNQKSCICIYIQFSLVIILAKFFKNRKWVIPLNKTNTSSWRCSMLDFKLWARKWLLLIAKCLELSCGKFSWSRRRESSGILCKLLDSSTPCYMMHVWTFWITKVLKWIVEKYTLSPKLRVQLDFSQFFKDTPLST